MKTKQLANVLIKILGLSVLIHSIPNIIAELSIPMQGRFREIGSPDVFWMNFLPSVVLMAIGIYLIIKSRSITEFLFKGEDE